MSIPLAVAALGGLLVAGGLVAALWPRLTQPSLAERLSDPAPPLPIDDAPTAPSGGWSRMLGRPGVPVLAGLGLPTRRTRQHLSACEKPVEDYLAQKAAMLGLALVVPPAAGAMLTVSGLSLRPTWALGAWFVFALLLWMGPDLEARDQARERSEQMRHTIAAVCDLVVISLAGGAGVQGALHEATRTTDTWAMRALRTSLHTATLRREPTWSALQELGERYQVPAATDLAASLRLAGADGARVRASLAAKASTLRGQHLADLEAEAHAATERMSLPVVLMFAGFLLLIGYPAVSLILTSV
ncbi:type II secretion system F family protein [Nocardiopsis sp. HNM0947]|uniref:Type II secretion system F family protein n=1 Tax=Nocardiopsis coralli TaxID=2772213 RepID=A0ABR9P030_9ACTN|nr:type II secretion system F family protein [Nocardiopsis coralli]MBE2997179.1 type II secretion system F family protein [Nocardiopsis coralli]